MTDTQLREIRAKNRTLTQEQLETGYAQTQHWLGVFQGLAEKGALQYLPDRPDLHEGFGFATRIQVEDLRCELEAYEAEFQRRGVHLQAA